MGEKRESGFTCFDRVCKQSNLQELMGGGGLAPTAEEDGILTGKILPNPSLLCPFLLCLSVSRKVLQERCQCLVTKIIVYQERLMGQMGNLTGCLHEEIRTGASFIPG